MKGLLGVLIKWMAILNVIVLAIIGMLSATMFVQNMGSENFIAFFLPIPIATASIGLKLIRCSKRILIAGLGCDFALLVFAYNPVEYARIFDFFKSLFILESHIILCYTVVLWVFYYKEIKRNRKV
jgi:hypothetical protein